MRCRSQRKRGRYPFIGDLGLQPQTSEPSSVSLLKLGQQLRPLGSEFGGDIFIRSVFACLYLCSRLLNLAAQKIVIFPRFALTLHKIAHQFA